jgi:hypothetical protein
MRSPREGAQLRAQGIWSADEGDGKARFFADLRALRDAAALGFDELAARAHYPSDVLKEAETGPSLPGLPILAAYVRACGGDVPEWEERWRRLGFEAPSDPGLPVRPAGASPAAVAGARAGVSVAPPEAYDPDRIRAVLRGVHGRPDQDGRAVVAQGRAEPVAPKPAPTEPRVPESPATAADWGDASVGGDSHAQQAAGGGWDTGHIGDTGTAWDFGPRRDEATAGTSGNGNHFTGQPGTPRSGAVITERPDDLMPDKVRPDDLPPGNSPPGNSPPDDLPPDEVRAAGAILSDPFSASWLRDSEPTSPPPVAESAGMDGSDAATSTDAEDTWFTPHQNAAPEQTWQSADAEPPGAVAGWFTPRGQADGGPQREDVGLASAAVADVWTPSGPASAPAQAQWPGPLDAGAAVPRASWSAPAEASSAVTSGQADRMVPVQAAPASPRPMAGPAVTPPGPGRRSPDRLSPVRLLVVIVVAALIGSVLVMILR